jgi:ABC-2 type transport system permease protein
MNAHNNSTVRRRVGALILRYLYLLRSSWPRILEMLYWPIMQVIIWGFISRHLASSSSWVATAAGVFIAAVLLWDVLFRSQISFSLSFLEEVWSRNLATLFISPLRPYELVAALVCISLIRTLIGIIPAALLAIPLYHYSIFELGLPLLAFFANLLVLGWAIGLFVIALLLRFGQGAESLCWVTIFMLAPISAIYYPVDILPSWLQTVAWAAPPAYVFEGMRAVMFDGVFRMDLFAGAVLLNLVYLALGGCAFLYSFRVARQRGLLLNVGE